MTTARLELVPYADLDHTAEHALVERLRRAEPQAVGQVYDEHHAAVRAFARRLVGDSAAAEDLVHEVFVSLPRAIRGYRGDASLRTFLISIAVNHARHHVRAAARRRAAMERLGREPVGNAADPEVHARRRELADALSRALDSLPLDQRVAFVLCEVEERSSHEAAGLVGVPEATVRTRLFHARRKLREALEEEGVR
jgi:RNA polymerase sigma-70 factor (ECF subfamily)